MRTLIPLAVAAAILAGIAGQALAQTAEERSANDPKFLEQLARQSRMFRVMTHAGIILVLLAALFLGVVASILTASARAPVADVSRPIHWPLQSNSASGSYDRPRCLVGADRSTQ